MATGLPVKLHTLCSAFVFHFRMFTEAAIALSVGVLAWAYISIRPPPPKICGTPNGPPVTSPRIRLSDGRHISYKETGVAKENAKYKVIIVHGFDSSKDIFLPVSQVSIYVIAAFLLSRDPSTKLIDELGIYIVTYDRAGYGESDPNPKRSVKSEALDIQEIADKLQLGTKFYVLGVSMGMFPTYGCLNYIPHRLAGLALVVPVINYWWPSFPPELVSEAYHRLLKRDQWKLRIAHYAPGLVYWWLTQKWFPSSTILERNPIIFNKRDFEIIKKMSQVPNPNEYKIRQQGDYESLHRDLMIGFGNWEFDPMELKNPFPQNEASVHLWQGFEDRLVPYQLQRYLAQKLPWIKYHEVPDGGHLIIHDKGLCETILRSLFLGHEPTKL
ncbi:Alpha/beta hydrolase fold-1 [Dillenia turbinata]|uniref:Alpha/beta hydrolase fold-1 n=1 Tax=Dillenia turbinata TaxID=194707 RepID=A0AAN8VXW5_9MAGN